MQFQRDQDKIDQYFYIQLNVYTLNCTPVFSGTFLTEQRDKASREYNDF